MRNAASERRVLARGGVRMAKKPVCALLALVVSGCDMRPPQAPAEEVRRRAELEAEARAATEQEAQAESALRAAEAAESAAKERLAAVAAASEASEVDGLAAAWESDAAGVTATPRVRPPVDPDTLARLRREAVGATHGREAAAAALKHVKGADRVLRERIHELDQAQSERRTAWQEHLERRYRNFAFASLAPTAAGLGMFVFGAAHLAKLSAIRQGRLEFASQAEYAAAKADAARNTAIGHLVALPLLAAGITMFVLGVRKPRASGRISVTGDGLLVRF
ncbi:hypothetical protein [Nannocystis pusilla]|uniref:hypothetical protein n=1 Tax=Nannocystis pusilla TaxID=889268 RepID=UPI003DA5B377